MQQVKYIGYFDFQDSAIPRNYVVSASNKIEYIVGALNQAGIDVELISVSASTEPNFKWHKAEIKERTPHFKVRFFATFGGSKKIIRSLRTVWHTIALLWYLLFHTHKGEKIIVYHSLGYFNLILWAKKLKRFQLILEVEEIYQDVMPYPNHIKRWEYETFEIADAFIFSTGLLNEKLNKSNKPYVVIPGTYRVEPQLSKPHDDGMIHVIYAGTFDIHKGGAAAAIAATHLLPSNYHIHICGFGTETDIKYIKDAIEKESQISSAKITYEGLLKGQEYIRVLQQCHIGLSTQDPTASFNATSFPSKILSYMANGLRVVSVRIDAITQSCVGPYITYYTEQTPQKLAEAIQSVDMTSPYDGREIISRLNIQFIQDITKLLRA